MLSQESVQFLPVLPPAHIVRVIVSRARDQYEFPRVTGLGVVPSVQLGYAIDAGVDGGVALVHLSIEI